MRRYPPPAERLRLRLVTLPNGCKVWPGDKNNQGYGRMIVDGRRRFVHRVAYEAFVGPIPQGLVVMHACDNPPCANVEHLRLGTQKDNMRDAVNKGRASQPPRPAPAKCGTVSGVDRHRREGTEICARCALAKKVYMAAWRARRNAA